MRLAVLQGAYFVLTGVWPLVHDRSFQAVTGPKADLWLVKTVGILIAVIGGVVLLGGRSRRSDPAVAVLAAGSAAALGTVDTVYAAKGTISRVYLLDALVEAAIVAGWLRRGSRESLVSRLQ